MHCPCHKPVLRFISESPEQNLSFGREARMDKRTTQKVIGLSKMIKYMLTRRPDEFGLVPEEDGSVSVKEFLQAIHEENDWRYVRRSHIEDIFLVEQNPGFELDGGFIRGLEDGRPKKASGPSLAIPPKLLYYAGRRRAHAHILERGISPMGKKYVALSATREMALRIGRRKDPQPVLFEIHAEKAWKQGVRFFGEHELIYLTTDVKPEYVTGPPLPKQKEKPEPKKVKEQPLPELAGSFLVDPAWITGASPEAKRDKKATRMKEKKAQIERRAERRLKRQR